MLMHVLGCAAKCQITVVSEMEYDDVVLRPCVDGLEDDIFVAAAVEAPVEAPARIGHIVFCARGLSHQTVVYDARALVDVLCVHDSGDSPLEQSLRPAAGLY